MPAWAELLRHARVRRKLTQRALAELAGVSLDTIGSYESGRRNPGRDTLLRLAQALRLEMRATNELLTAAGFDPAPFDRLQQLAARRRPPEELQVEIESYSWPCLVNNERMEIAAWNRVANLVAELDFARDLPLPHQRHLLRIACMPHFRERVLNWDEVAGMMIAFYKDVDHLIDQSEGAPLYFQSLVQDLASNFSDLFPRLMAMWQTMPARTEEARLTLPIVWRVSDGTVLRFNTVLTVGSDFDGVWLYDWNPADAATWRWLDAHREEPAAGANEALVAEQAAQRAGGEPVWAYLLRQGRESTRLTRAELATLSNISTHAIASYEAGRRRPSREALLRLTRGMLLDGVTTNLILSDAGHEPEPSQWSLLLSGQPPRSTWPHNDPSEGLRRSREKLQQVVAAHPWVSLIVNERCQIIARSEPAARLFGPAFAAEEPLSGSLLALVLHPYFREHAVNWDEAVAALLPSTLQSLFDGRRAPPAANPLLQALTESVRRDPALATRLQTLWQTPRKPAARAVFPLVWRTEGDALLSFNCIVAPWSPFDTFWAIDCHAANTQTYEWLNLG